MRMTPLMLAAGLGLTVIAGSAIAPSTAQAASFNCGRAGTPTERTICRTMSLNDRDVRMAQLYDIVRHLVPMGARGAIMDDQGVWIRGRNRCGADRACLTRSYDRRIAELQRVLEERVYSRGPF
jgi:uncharacterized protein